MRRRPGTQCGSMQRFSGYRRRRAEVRELAFPASKSGPSRGSRHFHAMMSGVTESSSWLTLSRNCSFRFLSLCTCNRSAWPDCSRASIAASRSRCSSRRRSIWRKIAWRSSLLNSSCCAMAPRRATPHVARRGCPPLDYAGAGDCAQGPSATRIFETNFDRSGKHLIKLE